MQPQYECPVCGTSKDDETEIYSHLMTRHRKSKISQHLLENDPEFEET